MATEMVSESLHPQPQLSERVARLEGAYPHLATKADLQAMQATLIKWIVGTGTALVLAMFAALQLFVGLP